jgi:DNA-binding transcriptional LysR family regulator
MRRESNTGGLARKLAIPLEKLAAEPLVVFSRKDYSEVYRILERVFAPIHGKLRIAVECDSASSLITEVEAGRGVARATKDNVTRAGEKFCEVLGQTSIQMNKSAIREY